MKAVLFLLLISVVMIGCSFLQVNVEVAQRSILDKGDGTNDNYLKDGDTKVIKDETETKITAIPDGV